MNNNETLCFVQYGSEGEFVEPDTEEWDACCDDFNEVLETSVHHEDLIAGYVYIIAKRPDFLDAYVELYCEYIKADMLSQAEKLCHKGLEIALKLIPDDFTGTIPWHRTENRPFLQLHHRYILCQLEKGNLKDAIKQMEQHLAWHKEDKLDVEPLLDETYQQAGIVRLPQKAKK